MFRRPSIPPMRTELETEKHPQEREGQNATVLIIADDADFARTITARWQIEHSVPDFTLMSGDLCPGISPTSFELALVGEVRPGVLPSVLTILESGSKPVVFLASETKTAYTVRESHPRVMVLPQYEGWLDALILIASEAVRAALAEQRAVSAEQEASACTAHAALGRFMLDQRDFFEDALTSVLGNTELLTGNAGLFSDHDRDQVEVIRNMALRMHEILQRFSSLETELRYAQKYAARQERLQERSAAVGGASS
jgi:hypothetical protein